MENFISLLSMLFNLRFKVQDALFRLFQRSQDWLATRIPFLGISTVYAKNFIIHCQILLAQDLHNALALATNQPRESTSSWLQVVESQPDVSPVSQRVLQFNQAYNECVSNLATGDLCSMKHIKF
jgi:hypothetical protein